MISTSSKILLSAFVVCCVVAHAYGSISCLWTGADGKEQKVNCTNADNKFCFAADVTFDGKKIKAKGCAGEAHYGAFVDPTKNMTVEIDCKKDGDTGNVNYALYQADANCCSGKDYCNTGNSGGRVGVGFGLVTATVASLVVKAVV